MTSLSLGFGHGKCPLSATRYCLACGSPGQTAAAKLQLRWVTCQVTLRQSSVAYLQLRENPYPTLFLITTRAAMMLVLPQGCCSPSQPWHRRRRRNKSLRLHFPFPFPFPIHFPRLLQPPWTSIQLGCANIIVSVPSSSLCRLDPISDHDERGSCRGSQSSDECNGGFWINSMMDGKLTVEGCSRS